MYAVVRSATLHGVVGRALDVEVHVGVGLPGFTIVGQPDETCRESRDRVRAACLSRDLSWPNRRITVNLAPTAERKDGAALDLAIAVGVLVGPSVLGLVEEVETTSLLAEVGIAILLFLVGLKLDVALVRSTGRVATWAGLGQIAFTAGVGMILALVLGFEMRTSLYLAAALTFSSTIIIVKILSDKRELDDLHGRIALGILIIQDIAVVLVMLLLSGLGGQGSATPLVTVSRLVVAGVGLALGLWVLMRWVLPRAMVHVARSQELLVVSAIAWAVSVAALSEAMNFSVEVGAFLAGFALASTPYRESIASSLSGLRDFLLLFFFIELGSQIDFSSLGAEIPAAIVLSVFVLVGKPLVVAAIMGWLGYARRVSFMAGVSLAQISEFSLILMALASDLGHVDKDAVGLVTLVGLVTIGLSTYAILYSHPLYERLAPVLRVFERSSTRPDAAEPPDRFDVIVYGYGRFGRNLVGHLVGDIAESVQKLCERVCLLGGCRWLW
jgi:Kef-type K+ transport system membrane component KefB